MLSLKLLSISTFLLCLLFLYLSKCVIKNRHRHKVAYAQNVEDKYFQASISAQRNFVDYVPLGLILLMMLHYTIKINIYWFGLLCFSLVLGRFLHALGLLFFEQRIKPNFKFRVIGMVLTFNSLILSALTLLLTSFRV